jgi:glycosyltransferase involved in cell wall biosynthesis
VIELADAVDLRAFSRPAAVRTAALRAELGIPDGRQVAGYLGLLAEYQGVGQLIYAARQVVERRPNTHFLIMGYPGLERYKQQAHDLQLLDHISFTGRVPYAQLAEHLSLLDVAVSAKLSATEGNGKLLNYMAMGVPSVAYDTPVAREILGPLGTYAPAGDVTALGLAIQALVDDPARRAELGPQLRARVESDFSWDAAGGRLEALYDDLMATPRTVRLKADARRV